MKKLCLFAFILFTITACQDDDDAIFVCNDFRVGDSISVPGTNESLLIDAVYQDNRCHCNAACIVAGGVGYRLLTPANDTLLLGFGDQTVPADTVRYNGRLLRLAGVTHPDICDPAGLEQADYCADFVFE